MTQRTSIKPTEDALKQLRTALTIVTPTELERDGTIQRFEYCYELLWKLARRVLKDNEVEAEVPRVVFRELGRLGWINNVEEWIEFQKYRNLTSHEYGAELAKNSYQLAVKFLPLAEGLLEVLKGKLNE